METTWIARVHHSDWGPQFAAEVTKELNEMLGISTKLSTAYHPQTDGQTERINQELEQYLRMFVDHHQETWPEWMVTTEFAYNNKEQTSTQQSPFMVNYGRHLRMGFKVTREGKHLAAEDFAEQMKKVQEEAHVALLKSQDEMKQYADQN